MAISVIIPTYKEPDHLELCIRSALETMVNKDNQILVYVDGTEELEGNQKVIEQYKDRVTFVVATENRGMCVGMNKAVALAHYNNCLIINDDMVFPKNWDVVLENYIKPGRILITGAMEPRQSGYPDVLSGPFGTDPKTFNLEEFWKESYKPELEVTIRIGGDRLPFLINKYEYLAMGGWDENCIHGLQADDEFFLKAKILKLETVVVPSIIFYHFSMTSVNDENLAKNGKATRSGVFEQNYRYLADKWGGAFPLNVRMKQVCLIDTKTRQIII